MSVYDRLKQMCKSKNISITALCLKATGNKGNLATWKNNNGHMRSDYLSKCADILNCSTDYLLGRETSDTNIHSVADNHGIIGHAHAPVTIVNGNERRLSKQESELLAIFEELSVVKQAKLLVYASELKNDE